MHKSNFLPSINTHRSSNITRIISLSLQVNGNIIPVHISHFLPSLRMAFKFKFQENGTNRIVIPRV